MFRHSHDRSGSRHAIAIVAALSLFSLFFAGCNVIDIVRGKHASVSKMVPGGDVATGELDCWVTLEFERYPSTADLTDVKLRFESVALVEPAEYDWQYIASRDVVAAGERFGSGHRDAEHTKPGEKPPLMQPTKVRLPLRAKRVIENMPSPLVLDVTLYWGGEKQDSARRTIEHVYARSPGGFL